MRQDLRMLLREYITEMPILSEGLQQHVDQNISIAEPVFRPGSDRFFSLIREARDAWRRGLLSESVVDPWILEELELGEWGIYEGYAVPLDFPVPELIAEAEYKGRKVSLGQPFRVGGKHKFAVYVRDPKTKKIKKVQFGSPGMKVKLNSPERRKSFAARHRCEQKNDKTTSGYWACRIGRYPKLFGGDTYYKWW